MRHTVEFTAPSHWASYLINGDDSGLDAGDKSQCDRWLRSIDVVGHDCVSCEDAGFRWNHDAIGFAAACDCQTYTFME